LSAEGKCDFPSISDSPFEADAKRILETAAGYRLSASETLSCRAPRYELTLNRIPIAHMTVPNMRAESWRQRRPIVSEA